MGMSASQARYIALTARMADTEYEAQQVNQQRLTLSNKMNEVYESLVNMEVPTPPSKQDFITYSYSGQAKVGGQKYKIGVGKNGAFEYFKVETGKTLKYSGNFTKGQTVTEKFAPAVAQDITPAGKTRTKTYAYDANDATKTNAYKGYIMENLKAFVEKNNLKDKFAEGYSLDENGQLSPVVDLDKLSLKLETDGSLTLMFDNEKQVLSGIPSSTDVEEQVAEPYYTEAQLTNLQDNYYVVEGSTARKLEAGKDFDAETGKLLVSTDKLVKKSEAGTLTYSIEGLENTYNGYTPMNITEAQEKFNKDGNNEDLNSLLLALEHSDPEHISDDTYSVLYNDASNTFYLCKTYDLSNEGDVDKTVSALKVDPKGEYYVKTDDIDAKSMVYDVNGNPSSVIVNGEEIVLSVAKDVDETEFQIATAKYENEKIDYDKEQNRLNKMTSIYQRQDKQLELKLTRLDTERNSLNTELEAVKKVIQDAIDKGFKTFSG